MLLARYIMVVTVGHVNRLVADVGVSKIRVPRGQVVARLCASRTGAAVILQGIVRVRRGVSRLDNNDLALEERREKRVTALRPAYGGRSYGLYVLAARVRVGGIVERRREKSDENVADVDWAAFGAIAQRPQSHLHIWARGMEGCVCARGGGGGGGGGSRDSPQRQLSGPNRHWQRGKKKTTFNYTYFIVPARLDRDRAARYEQVGERLGECRKAGPLGRVKCPARSEDLVVLLWALLGSLQPQTLRKCLVDGVDLYDGKSERPRDAS